MADEGGAILLGKPRFAHLKYDGDKRKAFDLLTGAMDSKGNEPLLSHGKFHQTYHEGANTLRQAPDFRVTDINTQVANDIKKKLQEVAQDVTPFKLNRAMKEIIDVSSNYLAQNADHNKDKGPAFKLLTDAMKRRPNEKMYEKGKVQRTFGQAAAELEKAPGIDSDHDDPNLSQEIHSAMTRLVEKVTPDDMKQEMLETIDNCSKYLSQQAVDANERGTAFDLMIQALDSKGFEPFSDYAALPTKSAAAYALKTAPGLSNVSPDPSTAPEFKKALQKAVAPITPKAMKEEMNEVVDRSADYLSGYIRDRGPAMKALLDMMKSKPTNVFATKNDYTMDYKTAAEETLNAPSLVPHLPVKDIAEEGKANLTRDMKDVTPPALEVPMKTLIQDVSKYLSQPVAMRSGAAGKKYPMKFLAAVKKAIGAKPLYKYKSYGQTYADAADVLENAGPLESGTHLVSRMNIRPSQPNLAQQASAAGSQSIESKSDLKEKPSTTSTTSMGKSTVNLGQEIASELKREVPTQLAPTIAEGLQPTMDKAAKHLAKLGTGKGKAMEYLVDRMKEKGEEPLAQLQGYQQTYSDGARRLEDTPTLTNEKVDKSAYENVKGKLTAITKDEEKPMEKRIAEHLPGIVEESAKFLSKPTPETDAEKRQVLGDLMRREKDKVLGEGGIYQMSYKEGAAEIQNAPVGATKARDVGKSKEITKAIQEIIPDKKMAALLGESTREGAAHLTDVIQGRGEAMGIIHDSMKKEQDKEFVDVGAFKKTHEEAANILTEPPSESRSQKPSPVILEHIEQKIATLPKDIPADKPMAKEYMEDTAKIAAQFIANKATQESGLDAKELAELDTSGFNNEAKAAAEARRLAAVEAGASGKLPGAEGSPGGIDYSLRPGETEEQRRERIAAALAEQKFEEEERKRLGDDEYYRRKAEKQERDGTGTIDYSLRPGETQEQRRKRIAAAEAEQKFEEEERKRLGDDEYYRRKAEKQQREGKGAIDYSLRPGETQEQRRKRIAAAEAQQKFEEEERKRLGDDEYYRRKAEKQQREGTGTIDYSLRPGETQEQRRQRIAEAEAEQEERKSLGDEEYFKRKAEKQRRDAATGASGEIDYSLRPGETEEQRRQRIAAAEEEERKRLGDDEFYRRKAEKQQRDGTGEIDYSLRPGETQEQRRQRIAVAEAELEERKRLGDDEFYRRKAEKQKRDGTGDIDYSLRPGETQEQRRQRIAAAEAEQEERKRLGDEEYFKRKAERQQRDVGSGTISGIDYSLRPGETEEQRRQRIAVAEEEARKRLGDDEFYRRKAEKQQRDGTGTIDYSLRPGETQEQRRQRIAAAEAEEEERKRLGDDEYYRRKAEKQKRDGTGDIDYSLRPGETQEQRRQRIAAAEAEEEERKRLGDDEYYRRKAEKQKRDGTGDIDYSLRPGETQEQRRRRIAAAEAEQEERKRLGDREYFKRKAEKQKRDGGTGTTGGIDYSLLPGETEEQRRRRIAEAEAHQKFEEAERRRLGDKEYFRQQAEKFRQHRGTGTGKYSGGALGADYDLEHEAALDILHRELQGRGPEIFYQQPQISLTHGQASEWLSMPNPPKAEKSVRESGDTARLHKKFERKLNALVNRVTPPDLIDSMQDVVIEGARRLSELFVAKSYKALVSDALISEMQKRGNEILLETDGGAETYFYAAQRLKKRKPTDVTEPCYQAAHQISKKLDDMIRGRPMARKLTMTMKDHIHDASNYLSALVNKPGERSANEEIEAYITLLDEMEAAGDAVLIEGDIPKTHKEAAAYLRQLTTFEDQIGLRNNRLQSAIENKLKTLMSKVPSRGYTPPVMNKVIGDTTRLLVSYIMLQGEKTEALKALLQEMKQAGDNVLLRHGPIRKSFKDGDELLRGKTADQLSVPSADPVVMRKIQIKLDNLMHDKTPEKFRDLMDDIIEDVTMYLAVHLLQPKMLQVCKCYKNVFVQCELWNDEILRRVARPYCTCSRHVSAQALQDVAPGLRLRHSPSSSRVYAPGLEITFKPCPSRQHQPTRQPGKHEPPRQCRAENPTPMCLAGGPTTSYLMYSTTHKRFGHASSNTFGLSPEGSSNSPALSILSSGSPYRMSIENAPLVSLLQDIHSDNEQFLQQQEEQLRCFEEKKLKATQETSQVRHSPGRTYISRPEPEAQSTLPSQEYPTPMFSNTQKPVPSTFSQAKSGYNSRK